MTATDHQTDQDDTIGYYDQHAGAFAQDTAHANISSILSEFVALLPAGASVLDWGCGTGRDSRALLDMGFAVLSVDASRAMCEKARELFGIDVRCQSFEELDSICEYDGIWACASLLHAKRSQLPSLLARAYDALKDDGVLYLSFKHGQFEGVRNGRWYTDLDERSLAELAAPHFTIERVWCTTDVRPGRSDEKWLNGLLRKHY